MEFKERIKQLRLAMDATMEDVAKAVGVSKATVQRWESGEIENIRRDKIWKLSQALHTTPGYLMGWSDDPSSDAPAPVPERSDANTLRIAGRDGRYIEKRLTDEQVKAYFELFNSLPDADDL